MRARDIIFIGTRIGVITCCGLYGGLRSGSGRCISFAGGNLKPQRSLRTAAEVGERCSGAKSRASLKGMGFGADRGVSRLESLRCLQWGGKVVWVRGDVCKHGVLRLRS